MFVYQRIAQYHETDQMGVIHHANYVKWMEEARVAFLDSIGWSFKRIEEEGLTSPVVSLQVDYKRPVGFSDVVEVRLQVPPYSGAAFSFEYEFFNVTSGEVCAKATSKHCFLRDGRVVSLKRALPGLDACLQGLMAEE